MNGAISFPEFSTVMLITTLLIVSLASGWSMVLASRRLATQPGRRYAVIMLNLLAALAVMALLADIRFEQRQVSQAWLLTRGSLPLDAAMQQKLATTPEAKLYVMQDLAADVPNNLHVATVISQASQILDWQPRLQHLTVLGDGLSEQQWQNMRASQPALKIDYVPAAKLSGFIDLRWPKQLVTGQSFSLSGQIQLSDAEQQVSDLYALELFDPMGNKLAEQTIRHAQSFSFALQAPISGNWLYQLQLRPQSSTRANSAPLLTEHLAVAVHNLPSPSLLVIQSAPSFETRQIKDWAGSFGSRVTVFSQISKNRFLTQYLNAPKIDADQIEQLPISVLSEFDLMIIDSRAISGLSEQQWLNIKQRVWQGAGLLILADSSLQNTLVQRDAQLAELINISSISQQVDAQSTIPSWPHSEIEQAIRVQALQLSIRGGERLVAGAQQQELVSRVNLGLGQIAVTLINNSYQWQRSGNGRQYSHYWQYLFSKLAANPASTYWLPQSLGTVARVQQADSVCALSPLAAPQAELKHASQTAVVSMALNRDLLQQERYCGTYWPQQSGWYQLHLLTPVSPDTGPAQQSGLLQQARYVYGEQDWLAWQQQRKQQASYAAAKQAAVLAPPTAQLHSYRLDKLWCWLLWLLCLSLLWFERKRFEA